ncbi:MAG: hypothetical protein QXQ71_05300 [Desulfurococcaceae archaeon]
MMRRYTGFSADPVITTPSKPARLRFKPYPPLLTAHEKVPVRGDLEAMHVLAPKELTPVSGPVIIIRGFSAENESNMPCFFMYW